MVAAAEDVLDRDVGNAERPVEDTHHLADHDVLHERKFALGHRLGAQPFDFGVNLAQGVLRDLRPDLCRDGEILKNVPPLGYVLGDEGSGAVLGRNLVNGIFKGHIPLKEEFLAAHGLNYEEIIRRVYREPYANRFLASFAPFIRAHIDSPEIRELVLRSFRDFASRNLSRYPAELPVSLLGGVAAHFEALLREALEAEGRRVETIVESPAEGLLKYHYGR